MWVHFPVSVLFCQPHQQLFIHSIRHKNCILAKQKLKESILVLVLSFIITMRPVQLQYKLDQNDSKCQMLLFRSPVNTYTPIIKQAKQLLNIEEQPSRTYSKYCHEWEAYLLWRTYAHNQPSQTSNTTELVTHSLGSPLVGAILNMTFHAQRTNALLPNHKWMTVKGEIHYIQIILIHCSSQHIPCWKTIWKKKEKKLNGVAHVTKIKGFTAVGEAYKAIERTFPSSWFGS